MRRVAEPELMMEPDQVLAYANADFAEPHEGFVSLLSEKFPALPARGRAVDLGCGPGDISFRFARRFPGWSIDALDASKPMLELAKRALRGSELESRISFRRAYLPESGPSAPFELVFSNSLLHHLADPMVLWQTAREWGSKGTPIFVMDLMRPSSIEEARQMTDQYAANEPDVLKRDFYHSLLAAYRPDEVSDQLHRCDLADLKLEVTTDRHFIIWGRLD